MTTTATGRGNGLRFAHAVAAAVCAALLCRWSPPYGGGDWMLTLSAGRADFAVSTVINVVFGVAIGAGLYRTYRAHTADTESELLRNVAWWASVLGSGVLAFLTEVVFERFVAGPAGLLDAAVSPAHSAFSGLVGIAFGAGFGQGEKLM